MTIKFFVDTKEALTLKRLFFRFLKQNNIYDSYIYNTSHCDCMPLKIVSMTDFYNLIGCAFFWSKTKEGDKFWLNTHNKWLIYINELKKNGTVFICS